MTASPISLSPLTAISPVDGRYRAKTEALAPIFSEFGLIHLRVQVECAWFLALAQLAEAPELPAPCAADAEAVRNIAQNFSLADAERVKALEARTNHDVKAVELFVKERIAAIPGMAAGIEFVHFACTSEDINNLAHALMLKSGRALLAAQMRQIIAALDDLMGTAGKTPMLARTHGQPASPTTLAKELKVFSERLRGRLAAAEEVALTGKMNGAVGNFNAHVAAYPRVDWPAVSAAFVRSLGLRPNPLTTQIEPHDQVAALLHALMRCNLVLLDLARDFWAYIAIDYFGQKHSAEETGSSTMPHKVNPIDFENAEGNIGVANALFGHMAEKLPVSRWQRDLSDSTVLRNLGPAFGHSSIACQSLLKGLSRLSINHARMAADLDANWEVLAEAVQTVMRKHGLPEPYERLKQATRGRRLDRRRFAELLRQLRLPPEALAELQDLIPARYTGLAEQLQRGQNQE